MEKETKRRKSTSVKSEDIKEDEKRAKACKLMIKNSLVNINQFGRNKVGNQILQYLEEMNNEEMKADMKTSSKTSSWVEGAIGIMVA